VRKHEQALSVAGGTEPCWIDEHHSSMVRVGSRLKETGQLAETCPCIVIAPPSGEAQDDRLWVRLGD
jgi:hypothetical protein